MSSKVVTLPLFSRQCEQILDLAHTVREVASLAGLEHQEQRLRRIEAELGSLAEHAQSEAKEEFGAALQATPPPPPPTGKPGGPFAAAQTAPQTSQLHISARELCVSNEGNRAALRELHSGLMEAQETIRHLSKDLSTGLMEAQESSRHLSAQLQVVQSEAENSSKEAHLARTEACTAIAHSREAKSTVEAHEARLRALAAEVQHVREITTDGFQRSNSKLDACQRHVSSEVTELREAFAAVESEVRDTRGHHQEAAQARQLQACKEALDNVEELRRFGQQRHVELQESFKLFQQHVAEQQRDAQRSAEAELQDVRLRLDKVLRQQGVDQVHGLRRHQENTLEAETLDSPQQPAPYRQHATASVDDMPLAWRTLLEDVVRRSQWACEQTKRGVEVQLEALEKSISGKCKEALNEQAKLTDQACQQASEALQAAQVAAEIVRESEAEAGSRLGQVAEDAKADLQVAMDSRDKVLSHLQEGLARMGKDVEEAALSSAKFGKVAKGLEASIKEVIAGVSQNQVDIDSQRAKLAQLLDVGRRLDEVWLHLEGVRSELTSVERYSKTEITAISENLETCLGRVEDTARYTAEQVSKKAIDVARQAMAADAEEAIRAAKTANIANASGKKDTEELLAKLRDSAHLEVRAALATALEEMRGFRQQVQEAAREEAREGIERHLVQFAGNLRNAALEEVRRALAGEQTLAK
eukprot:gb/GFBE01011522.1/.p1 GENE.gb/GFBE01011522.1/~~gb/GFBE01011522.1/.p1  ORF type:complete len:702 (+),score=201.41 gb/GFBE01011522.1/:1-2106(+)